MPVEIKEIVIRAVIDESAEKNNICEEDVREEIINTCINQILKILKKSNQR